MKKVLQSQDLHKEDKYDKCTKISTTSLFLFSTKMLIIRDEIDKMLVRIVKQGRP